MAGLYIHVPFCKQACHYCDFHFSTNQLLRTDLIRAMGSEIKLQKEYVQDESLKTIYLGGGTPSLLSAVELEILFNAIHSNYRVESNAEITLEANPDDLTPEKLGGLLASGINRLSIGIQSFDEQVLKFLNRAHGADEASQSVRNAYEAGFNNISIDLMYAINGQDDKIWKSNIQKALALDPAHISAYSLTLEEKTAFGKWHRSGKITAVEDEIAAHQFELLMEFLQIGGYDHYEISNFSKPGRHSRHNSNYWKQELYLGIGPSAHSFNGVSRQANVSNNHQYLKSIQQDKIPFEQEILSPGNKINEYIFTTLRTSWGCDLQKLSDDYHFDLRTANQDYLTTLEQRNLITIEGNILRLTQTGKLLADKIASDLFI